MRFGDLRPRNSPQIDSEISTEERRVMKFGDLRPRNLSQEKIKNNGGFLDTANNAVDWWGNNWLAGAGYLGGLLSETAGNILQGVGEKFDEGSLPRRALEGAGQIGQNVADKTLDFATKHLDVANDDNFSGVAGNRLMSGLTGAFGSLGSMIHSDKSADALNKASELTAEKNRVSTDNIVEYVTNPHGMMSDTAQLAGYQLAMLPFMALAPIGAVTRGVSALGGDAITQALVNSGRYNAAKWFAGGAPRAVQYGLTSAPVEGAMEGGESGKQW